MTHNNTNLKELAEQIMLRDSFIILCHHRPDGDTIGSALALKDGLVLLGKRAIVLCADSLPPNLTFLATSKELSCGAFLIETRNNEKNSSGESLDDFGKAAQCAEENSEKADFALQKAASCAEEEFTEDYSYLSGKQAEELSSFGSIISVDVASRSMLGRLDAIFGDSVWLKLDHHETGEDYAKLNYTEPHSAACGEIIFQLLLELGAKESCCINQIYTAISSDTGCFKYGNTTPRTLRIAAELVERGVNGASINHHLFDSKTPAEIRAITAAYSSMRFFKNGEICAIYITNEDKRRLRLSDSELGVLNPLTRAILGVRVGITIKQNESENGSPCSFKLSVRSEEGYPANKLCAIFGGGGHAAAAGATLYADSAEEALQIVVEHAYEFFKD